MSDRITFRLLLLAFLALAVFADYSPVSFCAFYGFLGIPCPGCGMTRSIGHLLHFDIKHAVMYHPFSVVLLPLMIIYLLAYFIPPVDQWFDNNRRQIGKALLIGGMVLVTFGLVRAVIYWQFADFVETNEYLPDFGDNWKQSLENLSR